MAHTKVNEAQWINRRKSDFMKIASACKMKVKSPNIIIFQNHEHPDVYVYSNASSYKIAFSDHALEFSDKIIDGFLRRAMADLFYECVSGDTKMDANEKKTLFAMLLNEFNVPLALR